MTAKILPSIMAKDQKSLDNLFRKLKGTVQTFHLDIADGKFVPNTSLWFDFKLPKKYHYQAHLMIKNPLRWIKANLKRISLFIPHFEELESHAYYIYWMKRKRKKVAFALKPETMVDEHLKKHLPDIDYLLILTVRPGFYGAEFLPFPMEKISQIKETNPKIKIIVDGGMNPKTIRKARQAGADYFISGSYITGSASPGRAISRLKKAMAT